MAFKTDIGRSHAVNQDAGGAWSWQRPDGTPATLLVVADGVSSGRRSEDVSRLVTDRMRAAFEQSLGRVVVTVQTLLSSLSEAVVEANHEIAGRPHGSPGTADATTLALAFCLGRAGGGIWVGDSRVYKVDQEGIQQLTRDHSWAESVVSQGYLTAEQAAADPRAHMITRWLGPPDQPNPGEETFTFEAADGDFLLCCSDGLYGYFASPEPGPGEMTAVMRSHGDNLQAAVNHLVDLALERGGHDNITVAALRIDPPAAGPLST